MTLYRLMFSQFYRIGNYHFYKVEIHPVALILFIFGNYYLVSLSKMLIACFVMIVNRLCLGFGLMVR